MSRVGRVVSLNLSDGGVPKLPVREAVVSRLGLVGDRQRNLKYHGGSERALCLYSMEAIDGLRAEGHSVDPGSLGENVTIERLDWRDVVPGQRLLIGGAEVEITAYAAPCKTIARWFLDGRSSRVSQKLYPGWSRVYARVRREGVIRPSDPVELIL
jgi:MOSC domain-containing protein YiiM